MEKKNSTKDPRKDEQENSLRSGDGQGRRDVVDIEKKKVSLGFGNGTATTATEPRSSGWEAPRRV